MKIIGTTTMTDLFRSSLRLDGVDEYLAKDYSVADFLSDFKPCIGSGILDEANQITANTIFLRAAPEFHAPPSCIKYPEGAVKTINFVEEWSNPPGPCWDPRPFIAGEINRAMKISDTEGMLSPQRMEIQYCAQTGCSERVKVAGSNCTFCQKREDDRIKLEGQSKSLGHANRNHW